jgi:hypothetical protein
MKRFLSRLTIFGLLFVAVASAADWLVTAGLRESKRQPFSSWNDIYHHRIDADLVVSGSSRAFAHISPTILEQVTGLSTYNLGLSGYHFPLQRIRLHEYLKFNRAPSVVIQTLDVTSFHRREGLFQYEQFLPYFDHSTLVDALSPYEGYDSLDRVLPMYRYRGRTDLVRMAAELWISPDQQYDTDRGFRGNNRSWDGTFDEFKRQNADGYTEAIELDVVERLDSLVGELKTTGMLPVLVYTPEYIEAQSLCLNRDQVIGHFQRIASKHGITFFDYSTLEMCSDRSLFYNSQHLNQVGAERFSYRLATDLQKILASRDRPSASISRR